MRKIKEKSATNMVYKWKETSKDSLEKLAKKAIILDKRENNEKTIKELKELYKLRVKYNDFKKNSIFS